MLKPMRMAAVLLLVVKGPVGAQLDEPQPSEPIRLSGLSLGLAGGEVFTASYRWTHVGRGGLAFDGAVATAPQAFPDGVVVLGLPLGPAFAIPFESGVLMLKGGAMPLIAVSGGGGGAVLTGYYGVALVLGKRGGMALRFDWTRHHVFGDDEEGLGILELGFVKFVG